MTSQKKFILAIVVLGFAALSYWMQRERLVSIQVSECDGLESSGDGVPKEYFVYRCKAKEALAEQKFEVAVQYLEKALDVTVLEAPNYDLKVELGQALCALGNKDQGKAQLNEYLCINEAELNSAACESGDFKKKCGQAVCDSLDNAGSSLNADGKRLLEARRKEAQDQLAKCL